MSQETDFRFSLSEWFGFSNTDSEPTFRFSHICTSNANWHKIFGQLLPIPELRQGVMEQFLAVVAESYRFYAIL